MYICQSVRGAAERAAKRTRGAEAAGRRGVGGGGRRDAGTAGVQGSV